MGRVIDDGGDGSNLGKRTALFAEIIDDPRLRRAQIRRGRRVAGLEAHDPPGQFGLRSSPPSGPSTWIARRLKCGPVLTAIVPGAVAWLR